MGTEADNFEQEQEQNNDNTQQIKLYETNYHHKIKKLVKDQEIEYMKNKVSCSYTENYFDYCHFNKSTASYKNTKNDKK